MIDTHAHLSHFAKLGTLEEVLSRAKEAGVKRIVCPSSSFGEWRICAQIARTHPDFVKWQIGIHPTDIEDGSLLAIEGLSSHFADDTPSRPVAIGEIGLDYHFLPKDPQKRAQTVAAQKEIFSKQLAIAADLDVPVCVHARDAVRDCIDMVSASGVDWRKVVFHCFAGTEDEVAEINALGGRASWTCIITYPNAGEMRLAMKTQGLDRIMFETDSPYLTPQALKPSANEPANVRFAAQRAAEEFGISLGEAERISDQNAAEFFGL